MSILLKDMYSDIFIKEVSWFSESIYVDFNSDYFINSLLTDEWHKLSLSNRRSSIARSLFTSFDLTFLDFIPYLKELQLILFNNDVQRHGFEFTFFPEIVSIYGLSYIKDSINLLKFLTPFSSSEYGIRPFILQSSNFVINQMLNWTFDDNYHVRRLASEGCRPRLPWGKSLLIFKKNPEAIIPILENLLDDSSDYVRRSVSNNLNDISKDNPGLVLSLCKSWYGYSDQRNRLIKHALRTLLKSGDQRALSLFGFSKTSVSLFSLSLFSSVISLGESLIFSFSVVNLKSSPTPVRIEYAIDFLRSNTRFSRKVFFISETFLSSSPLSFKKSYSFSNYSTRKHYVGGHVLHIIINGQVLESVPFHVVN